MIRRFGSSPSAADFEALAHAAFARIPAPFADHLDGIVVRVEEFADAETLAAVGLSDPFELTGLYHGRPMDKGSVWVAGELPPRITLYRQPLLAEWCETEVMLEDLVTHVVIHEVGHHFGLSDAAMHALEDGAP
ncbi:metallopeptidase family protein [Novosphingobium mangrovi (ex Huang et al. 2023)]|uniref:Metallopeptidase family protein n=1 Tax=Novosphingobium mangrovi (ex Huang et al. 2023) TaxID=2976432 RepID=A0ABT2I3A9_9SPHN|nr:metallopeptidase family protein [Novosphingobium mangrovi (ex Huang et al. 2023)]MCT2399296.1 metallopeptidase family protein [Novosphingobium mangrovi (ex Huang et al. 2023)]